MGRGFGGRTAFSRLRKPLPIGDDVLMKQFHHVVNMGISISTTWKAPPHPLINLIHLCVCCYKCLSFWRAEVYDK
jgi:hypothetical protein